MAEPNQAGNSNFKTVILENGGQFNPENLSRLMDSLKQIEQDGTIAGVIITGEGKIFAQGMDMEFLKSVKPEEIPPFEAACLELIERLLQFSKPVVAAINGHAFGLGLMIALACDYRVMRDDRGFLCLPEIDLGATLPSHLIAFLGLKIAPLVLRDLLLTGARIGAEQAIAAGVVDATSSEAELLEKSMAIAAPMLGKKPKILQATKTAMYQVWLSQG